ncbi:MAG TPA: hypothetical protein DD727_00575 [Clostridiales bacterium]|nr:hypothetical protein [Clostridiales bacterium]
MKFGVAEVGMTYWEGGCFDYERRLLGLKQAGYDGIERLTAQTPDEVLQKGALIRQLGMDFGTCLAPVPELSIRYTAAMGKDYVWTHVLGRTFDVFCRQVNVQAEVCARWGIRVALHNHMGSLVETQEQVEEFLLRCPECGLILDTAHLAAVQGDPAEIIKKYPNRLEVLHLKDWISTDPGAAAWHQRGRFCELGAGNIGLDNAAVLNTAVSIGFDGWVFVEQDAHEREPLLDLAVSREYLRKAGF